MAAEINTKFLTMYWPSSVRPKGTLVKQTSGKRTKGKKVPGICRKRSKSDRRIRGRTQIVIPIRTSQIPRNTTNFGGLLNQYTVFSTNSWAGLIWTTLSMPNQMKMIATENLSKTGPTKYIALAMNWSVFRKSFLLLIEEPVPVDSTCVPTTVGVPSAASFNRSDPTPGEMGPNHLHLTHAMPNSVPFC